MSSRSRPGASVTGVRVATYNLYLGADLSVMFGVGGEEELTARAGTVHEQMLATDFPARAAVIARILVRERVDVVGLQEVARWSRLASDPDGARWEVWLDFLDALLAALASAGAEYAVHACTENFRGSAALAEGEAVTVLGHNVVLVRRGGPVRVTGERTGAYARTLDIVTPMPGLVLNVARSWGWIDAEVENRSFRFANTHLEAWDDGVRDAQRDELLGLLDAGGTVDRVAPQRRPVVVVGDFNARPDAVGMPPAYVDAWAERGLGEEGPTCGQGADLRGECALHERIDYIWVRGAGVRSCHVVGHRAEDRTPSGLWPSDHAGVVAEIVV